MSLVQWSFGKNPKNVTDSACLRRETKVPTLSNDFPPETGHLLDSCASCDARVISSLQTMRRDKSFKVWDHHGNDSDSLPCLGLRRIGTGHGIPLKLAKASRSAGSPIQGRECESLHLPGQSGLLRGRGGCHSGPQEGKSVSWSLGPVNVTFLGKRLFANVPKSGVLTRKCRARFETRTHREESMWRWREGLEPCGCKPGDTRGPRRLQEAGRALP